jgi:hypothetical protein
MLGVPRPFLGIRRRLPHIVHQRRKPYLRVIAEMSRLLENHQGMNPRIDFRMMFPGLRNPKKGINLRKKGL